MKEILDLDFDFEYSSHNYYTRTSRGRHEEGIPISKIDDYQTSMSIFSTKVECNKRHNSDYNYDKRKKMKKGKKKVEFNPLISVVNIQSYKKENSQGGKDNNKEESADDEEIKKCALCIIF